MSLQWMYNANADNSSLALLVLIGGGFVLYNLLDRIPERQYNDVSVPSDLRAVGSGLGQYGNPFNNARVGYGFLDFPIHFRRNGKP